MHLKLHDKNPLFTKEEIEEIDQELSPEKSQEDSNYENALNQLETEHKKFTIPPINLVQEETNDVKLLKVLFEGFPCGLLKVKRQNISEQELQKMADSLTDSENGIIYQAFVAENGIKYLIEKVIGRKVNINAILTFVDKYAKPFISRVH